MDLDRGDAKPKPMVEVGEIPILVHIMKATAHHGFTDFAIAAGYLGSVIKKFFLDYHVQNSSVSVDLSTGDAQFSGEAIQDWLVEIVDAEADARHGGEGARAG